jgi:ATP-binding cassette, subfamily B, bacterial PglK
MFRSIYNAFLLLDFRSRLRWLALAPFSVLDAVLEGIGAVAIFSLLRIIGNPEKVYEIPLLSTIYREISWPDQEGIVITFTFLVTLFYLLKSVYSLGFAYLRSRFSSRTIADLASELLRRYLEVPYEFHLQKNSAELVDRVSRSTENVVRLILEAAVALAAEVLVLLAIIAVLVAVSPRLTLISVLVLIALLGALLMMTQRRFFRFGATAQDFRQKSLQALHQTLGGIKEIKVMGREEFAHENFHKHQLNLARALEWYATFNAVPRILVETVFVCIPLVTVFLLLGRPEDPQSPVPLLGLFAYAGFRAIPSFNRIVMTANNIRFGSADLLGILADFSPEHRTRVAHPPAKDANESFTFSRCLHLDRVSYVYPGRDQPVLHEICLEIPAGTSVGLVGLTGAGKSTIIDLVLGLLPPTSGRITVDGEDIRHHLEAWRKMIAYVPQHPYLTDDTVRRNIAFGVKDAQIDERQVQKALRLAQLEDVVRALPAGLETVLGERGANMSGGERQRVAIARALYNEPAVLIFDEATSALDAATEQALNESLWALYRHRTVIVVAHRASILRYCKQLVWVQDGSVRASGTMQELVDRIPELRHAVGS